MLKGKIAWVTGGGSGIGRAGAEELAAAGATVIVSGRRAAELEEVKHAIAAKDGVAETAPLDVTDKASVAGVGADILKRHSRVDILVNSAGMNVPHRFWKNLTPDSFESVISANLQGTLNTIAAVLPSMREQRDGLVINISSWAGRFDPYLTGPAYNASKHGVIGLTKTAALEFAQRSIRVNCVCPGVIQTPMVARLMDGGGMNENDMRAGEPVGRFGQPQEIGEGVVWLLSEASSFVTGHSMVIDGGWIAR